MRAAEIVSEPVFKHPMKSCGEIQHSEQYTSLREREDLRLLDGLKGKNSRVILMLRDTFSRQD